MTGTFATVVFLCEASVWQESEGDGGFLRTSGVAVPPPNHRHVFSSLQEADAFSSRGYGVLVKRAGSALRHAVRRKNGIAGIDAARHPPRQDIAVGRSDTVVVTLGEGDCRRRAA